jgi:hypothetical protein
VSAASATDSRNYRVIICDNGWNNGCIMGLISVRCMITTRVCGVSPKLKFNVLAGRPTTSDRRNAKAQNCRDLSSLLQISTHCLRLLHNMRHVYTHMLHIKQITPVSNICHLFCQKLRSSILLRIPLYLLSQSRYRINIYLI